MKQGKRWIALMLALAMCLSVLPANVLAAEMTQVQTTGWVADAGLETMASQAAVKLSSVKNISGKSIKVTWKKKSGVTGYQVQYSTSSKMKKAKTVTVKKAKATSATISKLKKGKKYKVQNHPRQKGRAFRLCLFARLNKKKWGMRPKYRESFSILCFTFATICVIIQSE